MSDESSTLLGKIRRGLGRDRSLPLKARLQKGASLVAGVLSAKMALKDCDSVGSGARLSGRIRVVNEGSIVIGSGLAVTASYIPVELLTGRDGRLEIGDNVWINFGAVFCAKKSVKIGSGSHFGQHSIISDSDSDDPNASTSDAVGIEIGERVWVAGRVTIRPGVKIGNDAVITAGSVVESDIPAGMIAGGIPARVLRPVNADVAGEAEVVEKDVPASVAKPDVPSVAPTVHGTLVSDFTIDELADELRAPGIHPGLGALVAPFGQVNQVLLSPPNPEFADFAVVWVRPETTIPSFARVMAFEDVSEAALFAEVDAFTALIERAASSYKSVFVPTWVLAPWVRGLGMMDCRKGGTARTLMALNARLSDNLARTSNVFVLNAQPWFEGTGATSHAAQAKGWYLGKMVASRAVMAQAAADVRAAIAGTSGGARKLLVLDLDDTLWGGIVGDVGWEGLRLGGLDGEGEAHVDFQRAIKSLQRRGVILAIVSKNEESVALEAIRMHPEMVLKIEDFVGWRINWTDKARNILELTKQLNLGLQSVVFIDDNPVERARVREALPEVFVPEWPEEKYLYPVALQELRCFDAPALTEEDLARTRLYQEERQRESLQEQVGSIEEWLTSLEIKVRAEPLSSSNIARAAQLLNKTNQLNLSTRRLAEAELLEWANDPNHSFWTVSVSDRFGDAGLTGLVSLEFDEDGARVVDYVLSCRVMGRKVEETMVHMAVAAASARTSKLVAKFLPTAKNKPTHNFWKGSGFVDIGDGLFSWDASNSYPLPDPINLDWQR